MAAFPVRTPARVARSLANILLVALALYLGITLAKMTWLMAWNEQPVVASPAAQGLNGGTSRASSTAIAKLRIFRQAGGRVAGGRGGAPLGSGDRPAIAAGRRIAGGAPGRLWCYSCWK